MRIALFVLFFLLCSFIPNSKGGDWIMYPNPANDHVFIKSLEGTLLPYVNIYNMNGVKVFTEYIGAEQTEVKLDLDLSTGSYIVFLSIKPR